MPKAECKQCGVTLVESDEELFLRLLAIHYLQSVREERMSYGGIIEVHKCLSFKIGGDPKHEICFGSGSYQESEDKQVICQGHISDIS